MLLTCYLILNSQFAVATNPTPTPSPTSSSLVLKLETPQEFLAQAEQAVKEEKFKTAIKHYLDYLRRFPADSKYLNTRYLLGLAFIETKDWKKAGVEFNSVIEKWQLSEPNALAARLKLSRVYIELRKWSEAVLLAQEVLDHSPETSDLRPEAHWLQARAHFENHNPLEAKKAADRYFSESNGKNLNLISSAELYRIQLRMKLFECRAKKLPKILPEQLWISQFQNQGLCLFESVPLLRSIAKQDQAKVLNQAIREWTETYDTYLSQPKRVPAPKKKINARQLKQHRYEMGQFFNGEYQKLKTQISDVAQTWDRELTPEMVKIINVWRSKL